MKVYVVMLFKCLRRQEIFVVIAINIITAAMHFMGVAMHALY